MNLIDLNMIRTGILAALPVIAIAMLAIFALSGTIYNNALAAGESGSKASVTSSWMFRWVAVTLVFGLMAAVVYAYLNGSWGWNGTQYLALAVVIAVALTVLEFVPMYETKYAPNWELWTVLNFAYAIGFGYLVPRLYN